MLLVEGTEGEDFVVADVSGDRSAVLPAFKDWIEENEIFLVSHFGREAFNRMHGCNAAWINSLDHLQAISLEEILMIRRLTDFDWDLVKAPPEVVAEGKRFSELYPKHLTRALLRFVEDLGGVESHPFSGTENGEAGTFALHKALVAAALAIENLNTTEMDGLTARYVADRSLLIG